MWKQHNFINKESNQAQESADTMLESLISRKLQTDENGNVYNADYKVEDDNDNK